jgi:hypothetical protein
MVLPLITISSKVGLPSLDGSVLVWLEETIVTSALIIIVQLSQEGEGAIPPCQNRGSSKVKLEELSIIEVYVVCASDVRHPSIKTPLRTRKQIFFIANSLVC